MFFKRQLPLAITFLAATMMIVAFFVPHPVVSGWRDDAQSWYLIVATFTMILGILNLLQVSILKGLKGKKTDRPYHWVTVVSLIAMIFFGLLRGGTESVPFDFMFTYIYTPLSSTVFSLLAFFVASASFRAFRAKSVMATILLVTAFIVMIGRVPIGDFLTGTLLGFDQSTNVFVRNFLHIPNLTDWIMNVVNAAGQRSVMIGAGLGVVATSLKIILGIERTYLGGE